MLIEIHEIKNHSPANLNRDDLGAPKTCYFGGVLRSRISSQCLKRSIRTNDEFQKLLGGVRTRQLGKLIADKIEGKTNVQKRVAKILAKCGFESKETKKKDEEDDSGKSNMLVYTTYSAIEEMVTLLQSNDGNSDDELASNFAQLICEKTVAPDMALSGRMLEPKGSPKVWKKLNLTVDAALQVAHAISTHAARPEVDYFVAADDIPGDDAGAGYLDEAMFASACFYKYFSIHWETLVKNLKGNEELAAHTVGAFLRGAALANPTGKQNSCAAHNPPDGILVEIRDKGTPISYANAFANPVTINGGRDLISQSIAQLGQYVHDMDTGFGKPQSRFWFSPNLRFPLSALEDKKEIALAENNIRALDDLVPSVIKALGHDWEEAQKTIVKLGTAQ